MRRASLIEKYRTTMLHSGTVRYDRGVPRDVTDSDYRRLLEFRTGLRRFLKWSGEQAGGVGLSPAQHQLLLAVRGHRDPRGPTIGEVAQELLLRHHSAVGLVDRAESAGLVRRRPDPDDHRVVRLRLTPVGARKLRQLSATTLEELSRLGDRLRPIWSGLDTASHGTDDQ
jgi:DNA-binding MarR family transcriptional regulator